MRFVDQATIRPQHCGVFPSLGSSHRKGYFDSGVDLPGFDNRVYVSVEAVEQMAKQLGWKSPEEIGDFDQELGELEAQVENLKSQLEDADRHLAAIEVMESAGYRARKKPGRPPREKVVS